MASPGESEHDLHGRGVGIAARQDMAGKLLNKALDGRHQITLKRYARVATEPDLRVLWQEEQQSGDIPGGYTAYPPRGGRDAGYAGVSGGDFWPGGGGDAVCHG
jgi:hypothetical protein